MWDLDTEGDYARETERKVRDTAYWLHFSQYMTTLGCIRLESEVDAAALARLIEAKLNSGEDVWIEVR